MDLDINKQNLHICHEERISNGITSENDRKDLVASPALSSSFNHVQKRLIDTKFSKSAAVYDSVAVVQRRIANRLVKKVVENWQEDQDKPLTILDAGCGTGYVGARLRDEFNNNLSKDSEKDSSKIPISITALDLSQEMLNIAGKREVYQSFHQADIEALPFEASQFDISISSLAIQWCHHPAKAIDELVRVTKERIAIENHLLALTKKPKVFISTLIDGTLRELVDAFKTVDDEKHVLDFVPENILSKIVEAYQGKVTVYEEVIKFDSLKALFQSLKHIGASALPDRRKGLLGRESYRKLEQYFQQNGGYQLTYVVALIEIP